ncbi:MAG: 16S rRNA (guanine(966)-N(2))-methyltransferase RsmD, partial [Candidatus Omnitrophica bacterium]|nr:16S rRNA (guanine(966)-N(2))-methyltransferase RsmD [Candidatus Omnitrophota bacterium]
MARIAGGQLRGRVLAMPGRIRATEAKVRQALFNILAPRVAGARVVDGYAGSGALGFEALSRGAAFVAFIESDPEAVVCIQENLARLEIPRKACRVLHLDVPRGLVALAESEPPFDLVLLDPLYHTDEAKKALNALGDCAILAPAGLVAIEHHRRTALPAAVGPLRVLK